MAFGDGRDWFFQRRYGLFVHWGLYAIHARHEQEQWRFKVPSEEYVQLAEQWNPTRFDPDAWLDLAEAVGMEYLCLTTRHHDGFCLWDTRQTTFSTMHTPYGRDIVGMMAEACHRRGFPLCLYCSIPDWHHPYYPNQGRHHELPGPKPGDRPDLLAFVEVLREQVRELCTQYGEIHGFWWDNNVDEHVDPSLNALIRELQPNCIINDRGFDPGDFGTPERDFDPSLDALSGFARPTEACQSVGMESWGYRADEDYYSDLHLQRSLAKYLARGGNYLLNVGPKADGAIPIEAERILRRLGDWYVRVRPALLGEPCSTLTDNRDVLLTRRGDMLYVICHREMAGDAVKLRPLTGAPKRATLLNDGRAVDFAVELLPSDHVAGTACLRLKRLPVNELAGQVLVMALEFDRLPSAGG